MSTDRDISIRTPDTALLPLGVRPPSPLDLAQAVWVYGIVGGYDEVWQAFMRATAPCLDLQSTAHRSHLLKWLNGWGCRQFARSHHDLASDRIGQWYQAWAGRIPDAARSLTDLNRAEIADLAAPYRSLRDTVVSRGRRPSGAVFDVTAGDTGAAKILFALRPLVFAPWDGPIRDQWPGTLSEERYVAYLADVAHILGDLAGRCGVDVGDLPLKVGRAQSTPVKLIDEYFWITITRGFTPKPSMELEAWLADFAGR